MCCIPVNEFLLFEVTNNGETLESDWRIEFDYANEIVTFWGGNLESKALNFRG